MDYLDKIIEKSNKELNKLDIRMLELKLNDYYLLLNVEPDYNCVIIQQITYIKNLIKEKKNK